MSRMIAPSVLAADFGNLQKDIDLVNNSHADWIHCDIMDGVFVPNISFGFPVLKFVKKYAKKPLDVHLMIVQPEKFITAFKAHGAYLLNVHYEASPNLHRTIQEIKENDMKAGVTLNPHTPVEVLKDIIQDLDLVLIMSVNPGFGGQQFIEHSYEKIKRLKKLIVDSKASTLIEVDGGVYPSNAGKLYAAGVDVLVAGTSVFRAPDPYKAIDEMKNAK